MTEVFIEQPLASPGSANYQDESYEHLRSGAGGTLPGGGEGGGEGAGEGGEHQGGGGQRGPWKPPHGQHGLSPRVQRGKNRNVGIIALEDERLGKRLKDLDAI